MYKPDLALNNQQWLMCHKTTSNQTKMLSKKQPKYLLYERQRQNTSRYNNVTPGYYNVTSRYNNVTPGYYNVTSRYNKKIIGNFDYQVKLGGSKTVDSEIVFQAIEANLVSNTRRVSGELSISQSSVVHHLHDFSKNLRRSQTLLHANKILQNF